MSRLSIVIGKALSDGIISTLPGCDCTLLFLLLGLKLVTDIISIVFICMLVSFSVSAFGIVIATFYESYESFSTIMNFIIMPMFFSKQIIL